MSVRPSLEPPVGSLPPRPSVRQWPRAAALLVTSAVGGVAILSVATARPAVALMLPGIALGAWLCARWPALATVSLIAISGFAGSLEAFYSLPPTALRDFLLLSLWVGAIVGHLARSERSPWLWPGLIAIFLYIALSAAEIFTAPDISAGLTSFRLSAWPMSAMLLISLAAWGPQTLARIARGIVLVALAVGAYTVYRKSVGPAQSEQQLAIFSSPGVPVAEIRFFAGFPTAQQMALFCATQLPFITALALAWRGRWRVAAVVGVALFAFAILASDVRTGTVAAGAGLAVVLFLFALAQAFPSGRRIAITGAASLAIIGIGAGAYALTVANDEGAENRFERILTPSEDPTVDARRERWSRVLADAADFPFGHGLGTSGGVLREESREPLSPDLLYIDSTFVKIIYEQGLPVMVLFTLALLTTLVGLAWSGISARETRSAAYAIGATGTLAALAVFFYSSNYIELLQMIAAWIVVGLAVASLRTPAASAGSRRAASAPGGGPAPVEPHSP